MRLLGNRKSALQEAAEGLGKLSKLNGGSPVTSHFENVLRFEQALLGKDVGDAVQTARLYLQSWPNSLLLQGDVVKILSVSGDRQEAATTLAKIPACEYRRRSRLKHFDRFGGGVRQSDQVANLRIVVKLPEPFAAGGHRPVCVWQEYLQPMQVRPETGLRQQEQEFAI